MLGTSRVLSLYGACNGAWNGACVKMRIVHVGCLTQGRAVAAAADCVLRVPWRG